MSDKLWYKVARTIVKAGTFPMPISNTLIKLLQTLITEEEAKFIILTFRKKPNVNLEEIKDNTDYDEEQIKPILESLMDKGIITGVKSRSAGIMVYRLMGPFPGIFEFTLMKGESGEKERKLALLFDDLFKEITKGTQTNYDSLVRQFKNFKAIDRVVPIDNEIEPGQEVILPYEEVKSIVEKFDVIGKTHCYCRHEKDLLGEPCKLDAPRNNCLLFGKAAEFAIGHDFAVPISKEETLSILEEAEEYGLVHKAFHVHLDPNREEEAICSCCPCCCGIFQLYYRGAMPLHTITSYLAEIIEDDCIGCGTCVNKCPMETIELVDAVASINKDKCIGCGVCSHHCPEDAIILKRTGLRDVFVPPPKVNI